MTASWRTLLTFLLVLVAALALAGCGGSDDSGGDSGDSDITSESSGDDGGSDDGGDGDGKSLFVETCGGCHTLADAGTTGAVGPNLDDAKPDEAKVAGMIASGGGAMPPGLLDGDEADAVAAYVAGAAGS